MGVAEEVNGAYFPYSFRTRRLCWYSSESKQKVVLKLESVAGIAHTFGRESRGNIVLTDPNLVRTIAQVHRIDKVQLGSDLFANRQPRCWIFFRSNKLRFDPNLA